MENPITIAEIMRRWCVGRQMAERLARESGTLLPRVKNGPYLARRKAFEEYMEGGARCSA